MAFDYKKEYKEFYMPKNKPREEKSIEFFKIEKTRTEYKK